MSLRLRILDALYSALDNGYEQELIESSPRQIIDDMVGHDIFQDNEYEAAMSIVRDLRKNGEI